MTRHTRLRDRRPECGTLDQLLDRVRAGESQVLVVRGEAGAGKTALLDYAMERASGFRVAIAEQTETPDQAKARAKAAGRPSSKVLMARDVVRIVTQGTLTEETLLEARENNYLAALAGGRQGALLPCAE